MRILLTIPSLKDKGGVTSFYKAILPQLRKSSHSFGILEIGSSHARLPFIYPLADQLRFIQALCLFKPQLVHLNPSLDLKSLIRDGLFLLSARLAKVPTLVFFHGWKRNFEKYLLLFFYWFFRLTFHKAALFIVLDQYFRDRLLAWQIHAPVLVGSTAFDKRLLDNFSLAKRLKGFVKGSAKIIFLGRLSSQKGVFLLLDALQKINSKRITLTIAGAGPAEKQLRLRIKKLGLGERVFLIGHVDLDQKRSLLQSHQIFCLPSLSEGMPVALLEAMALGLPLVVTPACGLKYLFKKNKAGLLVPYPKPLLLAQALQQLAFNPRLCQKIAVFNYKYAQKNFCPQKIAHFLLQAYASIPKIICKGPKANNTLLV